MSKSDAQRAMREAKYARISASGPTRREAAAAAAGTATTPGVPTPVAAPSVKPARPAKADAAAAVPRGELCGHRSMNGRACTREAGHAEKNHRYG